jgi:hypothetical protein
MAPLGSLIAGRLPSRVQRKIVSVLTHIRDATSRAVSSLTAAIASVRLALIALKPPSPRFPPKGSMQTASSRSHRRVKLCECEMAWLGSHGSPSLRGGLRRGLDTPGVVAVACSLGIEMTAKERLQERVDALSENEAADALWLLDLLLDPVIAAFRDAPADDEPWTAEDEAAAAEGRADVAAGRTVSLDSLCG